MSGCEPSIVYWDSSPAYGLPKAWPPEPAVVPAGHRDRDRRAGRAGDRDRVALHPGGDQVLAHGGRPQLLVAQDHPVPRHRQVARSGRSAP